MGYGFFGNYIGICYFFTQKEELRTTLNISIFDKEKAFSITRNYLNERGVDFDGYDFAYNIQTDSNVNAFLQKNFNTEEIKSILEKDSTPEVFYAVRVLKNLEKEEYLVEIDPTSERVIGFSKTEKETKKEGGVPKETAKELSLDFLASAGYDISTLLDYDYSEKKFPARVEQVFVFKMSGTGGSTAYGDFFKKVSVRSSGEYIYGFSEEYFIPEIFKTEISKIKSYGMLFAILSLLASLFMTISAIVIFFKKAKKENIRWKMFLGISTLLFIFIIIDFFNGINILKMLSSSVLDFRVALATALVMTIIVSTIVASIVYITGSAGDYYYNEQEKENSFFLT